MTGYPLDKRKHRRFIVNQPCRVTIGHRAFRNKENLKGLIVNISRGGAAIRFGLQLEKPPPKGTPVNLYIGGIGDFPSKVMRTYENGFAVAFRPDRTWDTQLIIKLDALLEKYDDAE